MLDRRLFISDLHIDCSRPDIVTGFFQFLDENKNNCSGLYILGDLFELWIGDDAVSDAELKVSERLCEFSKCVGQGEQVCVFGDVSCRLVQGVSAHHARIRKSCGGSKKAR